MKLFTYENFKKFLFEGRVSKSDRIDIYRDNDYIIVRPLTHKASCKYGAFSKWCISTPSDDHFWSDKPNIVIIIIIQKHYKYTENQQNKMSRFIELRDSYDDGEDSTLDEEETEEFFKLKKDFPNFANLEKIVIAIDITYRKADAIFDMNNNYLSDYYSIEDLPISSESLDAILEYLDSL